jgi:DnaJ family protein C protein 28
MPSIDDQIQQAMRDGKFDDLPGKGKPLRLEENPHEDPGWRLAYHVLKESGFSLPWIELRQEIEAEIAAAREALAGAWAWRASALENGQPYAQTEAEWRRAVSAFKERVEKINRRIFDYNLQVPAESLQRMKLNAEKEIDAAQGGAAGE